MSTAPAEPEEARPQPVSLTVNGESLLFPDLPYDFHERSERAVTDPTLQRFIDSATIGKDRSRKRSCGDAFGERYDAARDLGGRIKQHTLDHLDHYVARFAENAEAAGTRVHFARDAEEANTICLGIAKREGLTSCVKSKSMVTEETHLVPELERAGIEALETDLGEFILQLDKDAPSHIVTPMIHKDRTAVARAFRDKLGARYTEDAAELTQIARNHLRDKYRRADLGISGANFLVSESGSLVLCTNEGNGRFCTSAPRVHVAMVGMEKLVPSFRDLSVMLKLLARSSTGQPLTVYTHIATGPRRPEEHDGPEQMHVILVDNGRTNILRDEDYRAALRCIRCGACLNACPVYRKVSGHSYGAVYSGPIGAVITPLLKGLKNYPDLPGASSLCGACYEACPVKIDLPRMLIKLRRDLLSRGVNNFLERLSYRIFGLGLRLPLLYRMGGFFQRFTMRAAAGERGYLRRGLGPLRPWTRERDFPVPAEEPFRAWWARRSRGSES